MRMQKINPQNIVKAQLHERCVSNRYVCKKGFSLFGKEVVKPYVLDKKTNRAYYDGKAPHGHTLGINYVYENDCVAMLYTCGRVETIYFKDMPTAQLFFDKISNSNNWIDIYN